MPKYKCNDNNGRPEGHGGDLMNARIRRKIAKKALRAFDSHGDPRLTAGTSRWTVRAQARFFKRVRNRTALFNRQLALLSRDCISYQECAFA